MRITTVALGSFVVGALCMFFWGSHTSTLPQSVFAQAVKIEPAIPTVPSLRHNTSSGSTYNGGTFAIDGIESTGEKFHGVTFEYGGGAYKLENATVTPPINFKFVGAAANTVTLLSTFGMIGCPTAKPPRPENNPNQPIMKTAKLSVPYKGDLVSPFGQ